MKISKTTKDVGSSNYTAYKTKDGVKVYSCLKCTYRTFRKSDVHRHSVVHTGARPYVCPVCHKRFTQSGSLKYHSRLHKMKEFVCYSCSQIFQSKWEMDCHVCINTM